MTEPLPPTAPDALPTLTPVARVEGVSVPLIQPQKPRDGRARWAVALVATLVVILVAGGLWALAGAGAASVGPVYAPADAVLYMDVRADLPGDQRQQLAMFMAHFPGFADPSSLQTKLDQALDKLISKATNGAYSYTGNIESWFGGQVAVAVGPADSVLVIVSVSDSAGLPTKLDQTSQQLAAQLGGSVAIADHAGTSVYTISGATGVSGLTAFSFAITSDAIVAAKDAATVEAALDRKAGKSPNLAGVSAFRDAVGRLDANRLGTFYLDGAAAGALLKSTAGSGTCGSATSLAGLPTTMSGELQLQGGNLIVRDHATLPAASATRGRGRRERPGQSRAGQRRPVCRDPWLRRSVALRGQRPRTGSLLRQRDRPALDDRGAAGHEDPRRVRLGQGRRPRRDRPRRDSAGRSGGDHVRCDDGPGPPDAGADPAHAGQGPGRTHHHHEPTHRMRAPRSPRWPWTWARPSARPQARRR